MELLVSMVARSWKAALKIGLSFICWIIFFTFSLDLFWDHLSLCRVGCGLFWANLAPSPSFWNIFWHFSFLDHPILCYVPRRLMGREHPVLVFEIFFLVFSKIQSCATWNGEAAPRTIPGSIGTSGTQSQINSICCILPLPLPSSLLKPLTHPLSAPSHPSSSPPSVIHLSCHAFFPHPLIGLPPLPALLLPSFYKVGAGMEVY